MYLACLDKVIDAEQKKMYEANEKLIDDYYALPWWKKLFSNREEEIREIIIHRFYAFERWMNRRMREMKGKDEVKQEGENE